MAKKKEETEETALVKPDESKSGALVTIPDYGEDAGDGFEGQTAADTAYPIIALCQPGTPLVLEGKAAAGDWLNTMDGKIWPRDSGFRFVPATTRQYYAKWVPRESGGKAGFRGHLKPDDPIVLQAIAEAKSFGKYQIVDNGETLNLRQTFYVYGCVVDESGTFESFGVIPFWSTKIKSYRGWSQRLTQLAVKVPMYAHLTRFKSKFDKNDKGSFFIPVIESDDPRGIKYSLLTPDNECYQASKGLKTALAKDLIKVDYAKQAATGEGADGEDPPF